MKNYFFTKQRPQAKIPTVHKTQVWSSYIVFITLSYYQEALERAIEEEARGVPPPPASPTADSIVTEGVSILRKEILPSQYMYPSS